mmetsp:Transcript_53184/g.171531  ORF Transcript_53184/g.171531 Transcript_53184/m.171531 type:complete len:162 (+) Transcript_53184:111-596(+)
MRFAVFLPFSIIFLLQGAVRRMALQSWCVFDGIALPCVISLGVCLGSVVAPAIGTIVKLAAAMDPGLVVCAQLGNTVGNAMAAFWMAALPFTPFDGPDRFLFHANSMMHNSFSDMTTTAWVAPAHRDKIAHRALLWMYTSIIIGMCAALCILRAGTLQVKA